MTTDHLIDLHTHSTCSDGTLTPTQLVHLAKQQGLHTLALTDHDTLDGIAQAKAAAQTLGIQLVAGVEISTTFATGPFAGRELHILGLGLDETNLALRQAFDTLSQYRQQRNEKMLAAFHTHGIMLDKAELHATAQGGNLTKAHFARLLIRHGHAAHFEEAFQRYLTVGCPTNVVKQSLEPREAIALINQGGGVAILAHPYRYRLTNDALVQLVSQLATLGLGGVEAIYNNHDPEQELFLRNLAETHHLVISGGTDFHGSNKPGIQLGEGRGNMRIPLQIWENIRDQQRNKEGN